MHNKKLIVFAMSFSSLVFTNSFALAGSFKCQFKNQPAMIIVLEYPEAHVSINGADYPLQNTALPVMTASVNGATYEFGIKSYGATNATMPAKLEIRSSGWSGGSDIAYSDKTTCQRLK